MDESNSDTSDGRSLLRAIAAAPPQHPPSAFQGSSRFELLRRIGEGGFGIVYEALDRDTGIRVALKLLRRLSPESLLRFKQEFRALRDVSHENVIRLDRLYQEADAWFFTMEFVNGVDFLTWIRASRERLVPALVQLVRGVRQLHSFGIVHRDLKPSNVLVDNDGRVVLLDFGLAAIAAPEIPSLAPTGGTPSYMAPEQIGEAMAHPASDWYSVGVMLYEALTGEPPFGGTTSAVLDEKRRAAPKALALDELGEFAGLGGLCMDLLRSSLDERPTDREVEWRLSQLVDGPPTQVNELQTRTGQFVGRQAEIVRLHELWSTLADGRRVVVMLSGPSGVGKTALADHFLHQLRERDPDTMLLAGRCFAQESVPFKALDGIIDALVCELVRMAPDELEDLVPSNARALTRLFPVLARVRSIAMLAARVQPGDAIAARRLAFAALRDLFQRLGKNRRVCLCIDDLQWGDADSAALISALLDHPGGPRLMLLATYRGAAGEEGECVSQLLPWLRAQSLLAEARLEFVELRLGCLDFAQAREAALTLLDEPDMERAALVAQESGGLPLFIRQLSRLQPSRLARDGHTSHDNAEPSVPPSLSTAIAARISALPGEALRLLEVLAVASRPISRRAALATAGTIANPVAAMATLRAECFSRPGNVPDDIEVYHDRIREAVVGGLSPPRRRTLHSSIARSLELEDGDPAVLASHFHLGGCDEDASRNAERAGDRAMAALAFDTAVNHYRLAGEWWPGEHTRTARLERRRAEALAGAGRGAEAGPLLLSIASCAPPDGAFELRRNGIEQLLVSGIFDRGVEELKGLLAEVRLRLPGSRVLAMLRMLGTLLLLYLGGGFSRRLSGRKARPDDLRRADVAATAFRGLLPVDPAYSGYFAVSELLFARRAGDPRRLSMSLARVGAGVFGPGPALFARMGARIIERAGALADGVDDPHLHGALAIARGAHAFWCGHWTEALSSCDRGLEILAMGVGPAGHEWNLAQVVACRSLEELGRWTEARRRSESMLRDSVARGDRYAEVSAQLALAFESLIAGDNIAARSLASEAISEWKHDPPSVQEVYALRIEVYADLAAGAGARAKGILDEWWPKIRAGMHLAIRASLIDMLVLRGQTALATAADARVRHRSLAVVLKTARALTQTRRLDALAHAAALRGAVAVRNGDQARARELWLTAEMQYSGAGMSAASAGARLVRYELEGSASEPVVAFLRSLGIADPRHWVTWYLPGVVSTA